jgi:transcriptional pleiotropic regulator of transition state genes
LKSTGIVRRLDNLGRIVIPIELRETLGMSNEPLEIFTDGGSIVLQRYQASCIFCGKTENIQKFKGKNICDECQKELSSK